MAQRSSRYWTYGAEELAVLGWSSRVIGADDSVTMKWTVPDFGRSSRVIGADDFVTMKWTVPDFGLSVQVAVDGRDVLYLDKSRESCDCRTRRPHVKSCPARWLSLIQTNPTKTKRTDRWLLVEENSSIKLIGFDPATRSIAIRAGDRIKLVSISSGAVSDCGVAIPVGAEEDGSVWHYSRRADGSQIVYRADISFLYCNELPSSL